MVDVVGVYQMRAVDLVHQLIVLLLDCLKANSQGSITATFCQSHSFYTYLLIKTEREKLKMGLSKRQLPYIAATLVLLIGGILFFAFP